MDALSRRRRGVGRRESAAKPSLLGCGTDRDMLRMVALGDDTVQMVKVRCTRLRSASSRVSGQDMKHTSKE